MDLYNGIQTSKVTLDTICLQNPHFHLYAEPNKLVGQSYSIGQLPYAKEKFFDSDPWEYKINKYGFRGPNWDFKSRIALFGCSFIFGVGVDNDASQVMTEELGSQVLNMGTPGASAIHIIKTFASFARLHPMTHAFISLPSLNRIFIPEITPAPDKPWLWHSKFWATEKDNTHLKELYNVWNNNVILSYTLDYIDWAHTIAKEAKIKLYLTCWDTPLELPKPHLPYNLSHNYSNTYEWPALNTDLARDGRHPGPITIKNYADTCLALL